MRLDSDERTTWWLRWWRCSDEWIEWRAMSANAWAAGAIARDIEMPFGAQIEIEIEIEVGLEMVVELRAETATATATATEFGSATTAVLLVNANMATVATGAGVVKPNAIVAASGPLPHT